MQVIVVPADLFRLARFYDLRVVEQDPGAREHLQHQVDEFPCQATIVLWAGPFYRAQTAVAGKWSEVHVPTLAMALVR